MQEQITRPKNPHQPCCLNPVLAKGLRAGSGCFVVFVVPGHGSLHCWTMKLGRAVVGEGPDCPGLQHALSIPSALLLYFFPCFGVWFVWVFFNFILFFYSSSPVLSVSIASPLALLICSFPEVCVRTSPFSSHGSSQGWAGRSPGDTPKVEDHPIPTLLCYQHKTEARQIKSLLLSHVFQLLACPSGGL